MIGKEEAKKHNIKTIDKSEKMRNEKNLFIQKFKKSITQAINSNNTININDLADLINVSNTTANNQGYELTFAGKGLAEVNAYIPTKKEIKIEHNLSKNFNDTQNVIIKGDNIDALKILKLNYYNKIKMIYIDPPYNTQSENFIFKDNFKKTDKSLIQNFNLPKEAADYLTNIYSKRSHPSWLSFMYPRLKLARDLLSDDGVIFISIDDNEVHNLRCVMNEIFKEENFICEIVIQTNKGGQNFNKISKTHEYLLVYSKGIDIKLNEINKEELNFKYIDSIGEFEIRELRNRNPKFGKFNRPNLFYPIYVDKKNCDNNNFCCVSLYKDANYNIEVFPFNSNGQESCWRWGKEKVEKNISKNPNTSQVIAKEKKGGKWNIYEKYRKSTQKAKSIWEESNVRNEQGTIDLRGLSLKEVFSHPKPVDLIKKCLKIGSNKDSIILDFFAGSGTTAQAVMQLNAEDGGNRKFILVQIDEPIDEKKSKTASDFCKQHNLEPTISSICIERVNRAGEKILEELKQKNGILFNTSLDIGYKIFSLTNKPSISVNGNNFELIYHRESSLNTLYNMMIATCQTLDSKIIEIQKDKLYKINDAYYLINECSEKITRDIKDNIIYIDAFSNLNLEAFLNTGALNKDNVIIVYTTEYLE